jgi:hypothetical protein
LSVLTDHTASPKELAGELKCPVRQVAYHLEKLEEMGMVELARTETDAADGRVAEHFYRATKRAWFDRATWKQISGPKAGATAAIMGLINEDISQAITAGTFDGDENHISRTPMLVDPQGYDELVTLMTLMLERIFNIKEQAANRIKPDTETIMTMVHLIQFDLPGPGSD